MNKSEFYKKYLPSIVYGGSDGAVSYFTLMAGAYGAGLSIKMLIAIGVSNIFADAFSMATADYLSEDSRNAELRKLAAKSGIVTFVSFLAVGFFPIAPSIYAYINNEPESTLPFDVFVVSILFTIVAFFFIGWLRGKVLARDKFHTILQSILVCTVSAVFAYYIGEWVAALLN